MTDLAEHLQAEEREYLIHALAGLYRDEQAAKPLNEGIETLRKRIKTWHAEHPEDTLFDGEHGIAASFTERSAAASIDLISLAKYGGSKSAPEVLMELARAGLLSCSVTALRRLAGKSAWADEALRYEMPGGTQVVLAIQKVE